MLKFANMLLLFLLKLKTSLYMNDSLLLTFAPTFFKSMRNERRFSYLNLCSISFIQYLNLYLFSNIFNSLTLGNVLKNFFCELVKLFKLFELGNEIKIIEPSTTFSKIFLIN